MVTVTDANGCAAAATVTVSMYVCPPIDLFYSSSSEVCYGVCDGYASIDSVAGGSGPYTYAWSTGDETAALSDLCTGTYIVTVTDAFNCKAAQNFTIGENDQLFANLSATDVSCPLCEDGMVQAAPGGGTAPYSLLWSTGDTTEALFDLPQGLYVLTLTDAIGCELVDSVEVGVSCADIPLVVNLDEISCYGECDGMVHVEVDGEGDFGFLWSTGDTVSTLSNLCPGMYALTVTDETNQCSNVVEFNFENPLPLLLASADIVDYSDTALGSIDIEITGGSPPYLYMWTDSLNQMISSEQDISGLSPGCYGLLVGDAAGCFLDTTLCVADLSVAVSEANEKYLLSIYPNPLDGERLYLYLPASVPVQSGTLVLYDARGREMPLPVAGQIAQGEWQIDLPKGLASGFYLLRVKGTPYWGRFLKE